MLTSLPSQGVAVSSAQATNQDDKKVQSRPDSPHKDLPSPQDLLDEGKGLKKTKAKDTPLQPPNQCRFRDWACWAEQRKKGGRLSANAPPQPQPQHSQSASVAPKSEGNWLKRMEQKISGAFSGASLSALVNPASPGHSFVPAPPPIAAAAPPPSFATLAAKICFPAIFIGARR